MQQGPYKDKEDIITRIWGLNKKSVFYVKFGLSSNSMEHEKII